MSSLMFSLRICPSLTDSFFSSARCVLAPNEKFSMQKRPTVRTMLSAGSTLRSCILRIVKIWQGVPTRAIRCRSRRPRALTSRMPGEKVVYRSPRA